MSLDIRHVTNGEKELYVIINTGTVPKTCCAVENVSEIPDSIRDYVPDGKPKFVGPESAFRLGVRDELYPSFPTHCGHPEYSDKRCIAEDCKYATPTYKDCPYFKGVDRE